MSEVQQVIAIVNNPNPDDPHDLGRATVGYYVIEGKLLTMTHGDGRPFIGRSGERITQKLQRGRRSDRHRQAADVADSSFVVW